MPEILEGQNKDVIEGVKKEITALGGNIESMKKSILKDFEDFKEKQLEVNKDIRPDAMRKEEVDKIQTSFIEKFDAYDKALKAEKERTDALETVMNRTGFQTESKDSEIQMIEAKEFSINVAASSGNIRNYSSLEDVPINVEAYKAHGAAFNKFIRKDISLLNSDEIKALSTGSDPDGGYLVSPSMSNRIVKLVFETSPIRQLATVETISTDSLDINADTDEAGANWVGEVQSRAETTTPQLKKNNIPVHELNAEPRATSRLLEDASINIEQWLSGKNADKFTRTENTAFVLGNGEAKPRGLLTYTAGTTWGTLQQIVTGATTGLTYAGVQNIIAGLKEPYHPRAVWLMKRASIAQAMQVADGDSSFVFAPMLFQGERSPLSMTIMGYPIRFADDMPTIASDALSYLFGDVGMAYTIVDRRGIRILRDPYTAKPFVIFSTTKRVGGAVVNFEAVKIGKCATS